MYMRACECMCTFIFCTFRLLLTMNSPFPNSFSQTVTLEKSRVDLYKISEENTPLRKSRFWVSTAGFQSPYTTANPLLRFMTSFTFFINNSGSCYWNWIYFMRLKKKFTMSNIINRRIWLSTRISWLWPIKNGTGRTLSIFLPSAKHSHMNIMKNISIKEKENHVIYFLLKPSW